MKRVAVAVGPKWFDMAHYVDADNMDACDWFLNLLIRNWLSQEADSHVQSLLRTIGPLIRRGNRDQVNEFRLHFFGRQEQAPAGFLSLLTGEMIPSGVDPLTVQSLYAFERRLPDDIRAAGAEYVPGAVARPDWPAAFFGRLDQAFVPQMVGRFVRVNLAVPDDVLLEDLKRFLQSERAELANLGGRQPYRDAVRLVGKIRGRNLRTLAKLQVLPYLDIQQWREQSHTSVTSYALAKMLGLDSASRLKETRRYVGLVLDELALRAWLEPFVRGIPSKSRRRS